MAFYDSKFVWLVYKWFLWVFCESFENSVKILWTFQGSMMTFNQTVLFCKYSRSLLPTNQLENKKEYGKKDLYHSTPTWQNALLENLSPTDRDMIGSMLLMEKLSADSKKKKKNTHMTAKIVENRVDIACL